MIFEKFVRETHLLLNNYFYRVVKAFNDGNIDIGDSQMMYPKIMMVTNCQGYYIIELLGITEIFSGLSIKRCKADSVYRYFGQFDADIPKNPLFTMQGGVSSFRHLCLGQNSNINEVTQRFPVVKLYKSGLINEDSDGVFLFKDNFECFWIQNSSLINKKDNLYRCKHILFLVIFKNSVTKNFLVETYQNIFINEDLKGLHNVKNERIKNMITVGQLQNMYLCPKVHETAIGEFIQFHPEIVKKAFNTNHFEYEPYLKWQEHDGTCEDAAINPDLMIRRSDGYFDIYDLKTAGLNKKSITKAKRARRRFIDYVQEGIAQLANYEEYFTYKLNADYARIKYQIEVKNPKLVLIVGSWDNCIMEDVVQACRAYPSIEIIDYDTFCHLFLSAGEEVVK